MVFSEVQNDILENNIFGVDINEESVEIAKLSLWLRTAKKGRKLTTLNSNIKCGNSLIDDPEVADDKAFNWEDEFPEVFENGGFDVILGNPPYVRHELIKNYKKKFKDQFTSFQSTADLYVYFFEKAIQILRPNGLLGYITANKFMKASYGENLRKFLQSYRLYQIIDFGELPVFQDAATFPAIYLISNTERKPIVDYCQIENLKFSNLEVYVKEKSIQIFTKHLNKEPWRLISSKDSIIIEKMENISTPLHEFISSKIYRGLVTGLNEAFVIDIETKNNLIEKDPNSKDIIKKFAVGNDIRNYHVNDNNTFLIFTPIGVNINNYPAVFEHLSQHQEKLEKRWDKGNHWWELRACDYYSLFEEPKIIYPDIAKESRMVLDENNFFMGNTCYFIPTQDFSLLAILNSKPIYYFYQNVATALGNAKKGGRLRWFTQDVKNLPIPPISGEIKSTLINYSTDIQSQYHKLLNIKNKFIRLFSRKFQVEKLSKKLENWQILVFPEFVKELKKKKINLGLAEETEWEDYFLTEQQKVQTLQSQIDRSDKEINQIVYKLYGLTEEEIKIVQEATT